MLEVGCHIMFHDTRRSPDFHNVCELANHYFTQILSIEVNKLNSNITVVTKREKLEYENWNTVEKREAWQAGYEAPDRSFYNK